MSVAMKPNIETKTPCASVNAAARGIKQLAGAALPVSDGGIENTPDRHILQTGPRAPRRLALAGWPKVPASAPYLRGPTPLSSLAEVHAHDRCDTPASDLRAAEMTCRSIRDTSNKLAASVSYRVVSSWQLPSSLTPRQCVPSREIRTRLWFAWALVAWHLHNRKLKTRV